MIDPRAALSRALSNFKRFDLGTNGHRDVVSRDIPNAIDAMIADKIKELDVRVARELAVLEEKFEKERTKWLIK